MGAEVFKPKIIVICGPTALGKTSAAIHLARRFNGEIIGADSMQVYRYMDVGTAKPTTEEQACVPHHMIDIVDPDEHFDARQYSELAREKIMKLHARNILPFVVGGTGLYIKALVHGLFETEPSDSGIRNRLKEKVEICGSSYLHKQLRLQDPDTAKRIHPNDTYRIVRALEVLELTGKPIAQFHRDHGFNDHPFLVLKIGLYIDREVLYDRIDRRVDEMINIGLVREVNRLLKMGYSARLKSMQSIGYRHMVDFIEKNCPWDETVDTMKRDTRRYAKRQLTWFRADSEIVWRTPEQLGEISRMIKNFLKEK